MQLDEPFREELSNPRVDTSLKIAHFLESSESSSKTLFLSCNMICVISDHKSKSGSSQRNAPFAIFFAFFYGRKQRTNRQFRETRASVNFLNISWDQDVRITRTFDWTTVFDHVLSKFFLKGDRGKLFSAGPTCIRQILLLAPTWGMEGVSTATTPNNTLLCYYSVLPNNNIFRIIIYSEL